MLLKLKSYGDSLIGVPPQRRPTTRTDLPSCNYFPTEERDRDKIEIETRETGKCDEEDNQIISRNLRAAGSLARSLARVSAEPQYALVITPRWITPRNERGVLRAIGASIINLVTCKQLVISSLSCLLHSYICIQGRISDRRGNDEKRLHEQTLRCAFNNVVF